MPRWMPLLALLLCSSAASQTAAGWRSMFDGKSLQGWREAQFTRRGEVRVKDGAIVLGAGGPMTGVNWTEPFPKSDYEVRFEGVRLQGNDFFASLTVPFGESHFTWVLGGWGGDIVGLSSIDGWDASENETRTYFNFENGRWYTMRLRVEGTRISAWIDDQRIIHVDVAGREVSLRPGEIEQSAPFGFASYGTSGAVRKMEYRVLR